MTALAGSSARLTHAQRIETPTTLTSARAGRDGDRVLTKAQSYRSTTRGRATHLLANAKYRAAEAGREFNLTREWLEAKLNHGLCEATNVPFDLMPGLPGQGRGKLRVPSLDRKDPAGGYTEANTVLVCWAFNALKATSTYEQALAFMREVARG